MTSRTTLALALSLLLAAPFAATTSADPTPRTISLTANDNMKFSVTEITAKRGESLQVVMRVVGTIPKVAMAHNFVVLKKGTKADAFINASATARATDFIAPAVRNQVLAATALAGAGETVRVTFTVPQVAGRYDFVCTFPGHFAGGMRGVLIVKLGEIR
jgi:azurin